MATFCWFVGDIKINVAYISKLQYDVPIFFLISSIYVVCDAQNASTFEQLNVKNQDS